MTEKDLAIPSYHRKPRENTAEWYEFHIRAIDHRISRLSALGLAPHPTLLENRKILQSQLEQLENSPPCRGLESS